MKLTTTLLLAASLSPLFAAASLEVPPALAHQKALQASLTSSLRASVDEVALQASLIRSAHAQLKLDLASGNARAAKVTQALLDGYHEAFMKAQQNVRASLLQLQTRTN